MKKQVVAGLMVAVAMVSFGCSGVMLNLVWLI